jgi:hypothetical protein
VSAPRVNFTLSASDPIRRHLRGLEIQLGSTASKVGRYRYVPVHDHPDALDERQEAVQRNHRSVLWPLANVPNHVVEAMQEG